MGWRENFKAGWNAEPGTYQRANPPPRREEPPYQPPPPPWQEEAHEERWQEPAPDGFADEISRQLDEYKSTITELIAEIGKRDAELEQRRAYIAEQAALLQERDQHLAKFEAATAALIAQMQEMHNHLGAAIADRDRYQAELSRLVRDLEIFEEILLYPGVKKALSKIFHPDLHRSDSAAESKAREELFKKMGSFYDARRE